MGILLFVLIIVAWMWAENRYPRFRRSMSIGVGRWLMTAYWAISAVFARTLLGALWLACWVAYNVWAYRRMREMYREKDAKAVADAREDLLQY